MTAPVLLQPKPQFCDASGKPYVGGLLATFVRGTTAPKTTWKDPDQAAVNTNPITLDAAGECSMWGDGDYRLILYDAANNLIWDQPSTTVVSAAMYPVTSAPTTLDAMNAMGVTGAISAEAAARNTQIVTAISLEATTRASADDAITNYATAAIADLVAVDLSLEAVDASLQAQISALSGTPVITAIGGQHNMHFGIGVTSASVSFTFATPFPTACLGMTVTPADQLFAPFFSGILYIVSGLSRTGATVTAIGTGAATPAAFDTVFSWVATGN